MNIGISKLILWHRIVLINLSIHFTDLFLIVGHSI